MFEEIFNLRRDNNVQYEIQYIYIYIYSYFVIFPDSILDDTCLWRAIVCIIVLFGPKR